MARAVTYVTTVIIRLDAAAGCWGRGCRLGRGGRAKQVSADSLTQFGPASSAKAAPFTEKLQPVMLDFGLSSSQHRTMRHAIVSGVSGEVA